MIKADPWHEVLGVEKSCTEQELKTAFRRLVSQFHPDRFPPEHTDLINQAVAKMTRLNKAYKEGKAEVAKFEKNQPSNTAQPANGNRFRSRFED